MQVPRVSSQANADAEPLVGVGPSPAESVATRQRRDVSPLVRRALERPELGLVVFLLILGITIQSANGNFGTPQNLTNLSRQATVLAVLATGQLFVILV